MGTVTYPNEGVSKFVELNFIPVQIEITNKELTDKYSVTWTPTILVLDAEGRNITAPWVLCPRMNSSPASR